MSFESSFNTLSHVSGCFTGKSISKQLNLQSGYLYPFPSPVAVCQYIMSARTAFPYEQGSHVAGNTLCFEDGLDAWCLCFHSNFGASKCSPSTRPALMQAGQRRSSASRQSGWSSKLFEKVSREFIDDQRCHNLRSMSRRILTSSLVTKLMATPLRPNLPERPIRWM